VHGTRRAEEIMSNIDRRYALHSLY
jgi:hypothetical protein